MTKVEPRSAREMIIGCETTLGEIEGAVKNLLLLSSNYFVHAADENHVLAWTINCLDDAVRRLRDDLFPGGFLPTDR